MTSDEPAGAAAETTFLVDNIRAVWVCWKGGPADQYNVDGNDGFDPLSRAEIEADQGPVTEVTVDQIIVLDRSGERVNGWTPGTLQTLMVGNVEYSLGVLNPATDLPKFAVDPDGDVWVSYPGDQDGWRLNGRGGSNFLPESCKEVSADRIYVLGARGGRSEGWTLAGLKRFMARHPHHVIKATPRSADSTDKESS